jgi:hypothetical protein
MVDRNYWHCSLCNQSGKFGVVDTFAQHVRGKDHIQAQKNKIAGGISGNQLTIQASLAKGVLSGKAKYPPFYVPKPIDIPRDEMVSYCCQNICHGFHDYLLKLGESVIDVRPLLNDPISGKNWYADPNYKCRIQSPSSEIMYIEGTFRHVECTSIFCDKCLLIPSFSDFRKRAWQLTQMLVQKGERKCEPGIRLDMYRLTSFLNHVENGKKGVKMPMTTSSY